MTPGAIARAIARWLGLRGPCRGDLVRYTGPTKARLDGALLLRGALLRVDRVYEHRLVTTDSRGQRFSVRRVDVTDAWERAA